MGKIMEIFQNATFWNWLALLSIAIALIWFPLNAINFYFNTIPKLKDWFSKKNKSRFNKRLIKKIQIIKTALAFKNLQTNLAIAQVGYALLQAIISVFIYLAFLIFISTSNLYNSNLLESLRISNLLINIIGLKSEPIETSYYNWFGYYALGLIMFFFTALTLLNYLNELWSFIFLKNKIQNLIKFLEIGKEKKFIEKDDKRIIELNELLNLSNDFEDEIKQLNKLQN